MSFKLTMLSRVPQSLPSAADLLFYPLLSGTIPATSSGHWIVVLVLDFWQHFIDRQYRQQSR